MLREGSRVRGIQFVGYKPGTGKKKGLWKCPFCGRVFPALFHYIFYHGDVYSCGCRTAEEAREHYYEAITDALKSNGYIVTVACAAVGISYAMYKNFLQDPKFQELCEEAREFKMDIIERAYVKKVFEGNMRAIEIGLKSTMMRARGYAPAVAESPEQLSLDLGEKIVDDLK
jgi:hypothetical protein